MDPLSAISLAGTILQFVDFSSKLIAGTYEVYKSIEGTTAENADISAVVGDLHLLTEDLDSDIPGSTKHEKALKVLAGKCRDLSESLIVLVERLKVSGKSSTWKSLRVKLMAMRKGQEIERIEGRLGEYRTQILLRLTLMLGDQQSSMKTQLDQIQTTSERLSTTSAMSLAKIREDILQVLKELKDRQPPSSAQQHHELPAGQPDDLAVQQANILSERLKMLSSMMNILPVENRILESLWFPENFSREDSVRDADIGTFRWLLEEENSSFEDWGGDDESQSPGSQGGTGSETGTSEPLSDNDDSYTLSSSVDGDHRCVQRDRVSQPRDNQDGGSVPRSTVHSFDDGLETFQRRLAWGERERKRAVQRSFLIWLRTGKGIFHISGKAGSGKSTLMKFLCNNWKLMEQLQAWSGDQELIFCRFFFWGAGSELQKSLRGLYRSLLYEFLRKCPDLIQDVFPSQWTLFGKSNSLRALDSTLFRPAQIEDALGKLMCQTKYRFCIFIDGLDEYDGDSVDHTQLANMLNSWASGEHIKICVSSRPHVEFHTTFARYSDQTIHLHEWTRHDIYVYCRRMLDDAMDGACVTEEYLSLVHDIVSKAHGVFLWAMLVTRTLKSGILRGDSIERLRSTLDTTPRELDILYTQLLDSMEPHDRRRAAQMLLMVAHDTVSRSSVTRPLTNIAFFWLDELETPDFPVASDISPFTEIGLQEVGHIMDRQVTSLTKGLLELSDGAISYGRRRGCVKNVQFFHRTARDFILEHSKLRQIVDLEATVSKETNYRLRLAELMSVSGLDRKSIGNSYLRNAPGFRELPIPLLEKYHEMFQEIREHANATHEREYFKVTHEAERGHNLYMCTLKSPEITQFVELWQPSFVHFAATQGRRQYVVEAAKNDRSLLTKPSEFNLLFSAGMFGHSELIQELIQIGASLDQPILCYREDESGNLDTNPDNAQSYPTWLVLLSSLVSSVFRWSVRPDEFWSAISEVLEIVLRHKPLPDCLIFMYGTFIREWPYRGGPLPEPIDFTSDGAISLLELIKADLFTNKDQLLSLLAPPTPIIRGSVGQLSEMVRAHWCSRSLLESDFVEVAFAPAFTSLRTESTVISKLVCGPWEMPGNMYVRYR